MMTGTYEIIYADPPWRYSAKRVQGAAENHYPTTTLISSSSHSSIERAANTVPM